jgi:hypothetical protein
MKEITSAAELNAAIEALEIARTADLELLKAELLQIQKGLSPVNLIKNAVGELADSTDLKSDLVTVGISLLLKTVSKTAFVSSTLSGLGLEAILQKGFSLLLKKGAPSVKDLINKLFHSVGYKKETTAS